MVDSNSSSLWGGGGGALTFGMATHCKTATHSGSVEPQNLSTINSFEGKIKKKGGGGGQFKTEYLIRVVT